MNGRQYMGRWYRPAIDYPVELVDQLPGQGIGNPYWQCRGCGCGARMLGIYWCKRCADARIAQREAEPAEVARRQAAVRLANTIRERVAAGGYDAVALRRWFGSLWSLRRGDEDELRVAVCAVAEAMSATLPAVPIRVDSVLPFTAVAVFEGKVAEYLAARGNHRPIVVIGWPTHGERQLVDGRHRLSAALFLGLETIPAVFAMTAAPRRWNGG